jgi:hypothetical protein
MVVASKKYEILGMLIIFFSFLTMYVQVVNRINQKIVEEKQFDSIFEQNAVNMLGLCTDAIGGAVYAFNHNTLYEVSPFAAWFQCDKRLHPALLYPIFIIDVISKS